MRRARPQRASRRALVLVALAAAFLMISRTTGSGWVVVLVCGVLAVLAVATALPAVGVARADVSARGPRDATVGQAAALRVEVRRGRGLRLRVVDPPGEWLAADAPAAGDVVVRPARRGVFSEIEVEVATAAPLGLLWWRRRLRVALPEPVEVAPRPVECPVPTAAPATGRDAQGVRRRAGQDVVRGVREYAPGDPARLVHWPATARWGDLMVKELETSTAPGLAIVVDLRGDEDSAELAASRAAGLAGAALAAGLALTMLTAERRGPVAGDVGGPTDAGRRLARAVPGAPAEGPLPVGAAVVRVTASAGEAGHGERP